MLLRKASLSKSVVLHPIYAICASAGRKSIPSEFQMNSKSIYAFAGVHKNLRCSNSRVPLNTEKTRKPWLRHRDRGQTLTVCPLRRVMPGAW
jgi:hypothetical protein